MDPPKSDRPAAEHHDLNIGLRGYTVQIEDICVEPGLMALYDALDRAGRDQLPAVAPGTAIGRARGSELRVMIRDTGMFMDPRSEPDWWRRKRAR